MKYMKFFNKLLKKICYHVGAGKLDIDHAIEKIRTNGQARLATWIDAYDEIVMERDWAVSAMLEKARRVDFLNKHIREIDAAMEAKKVGRCPDCLGNHWGQKSKKGSGDPCLVGDWKDCETCNGTGIVSTK